MGRIAHLVALLSLLLAVGFAGPAHAAKKGKKKKKASTQVEEKPAEATSGGAAQKAAEEANSPTPADMEEAERLFMEGLEAYDDEKYAQALVKFLDSYDIYPADEILYNIAYCYEQLDQTNKAVEYYEKYLATLPEDAEKERAEIMATVEVLEGEEGEAEVEDKSKVQQFKEKVTGKYKGAWMHGLWVVLDMDFIFERGGYYPNSRMAGLGVKAAYNLRLLEQKLSLAFELGYLTVQTVDEHAWSIVMDLSAGYRVGNWRRGSLQLYLGGALDLKYYKTRTFTKFGTIGIGPFARLYWHWSEKVGLLAEVMPVVGFGPGKTIYSSAAPANGYVYGYLVVKLGFFFGLK